MNQPTDSRPASEAVPPERTPVTIPEGATFAHATVMELADLHRITPGEVVFIARKVLASLTIPADLVRAATTAAEAPERVTLYPFDRDNPYWYSAAAPGAETKHHGAPLGVYVRESAVRAATTGSPEGGFCEWCAKAWPISGTLHRFANGESVPCAALRSSAPAPATARWTRDEQILRLAFELAAIQCAESAEHPLQAVDVRWLAATLVQYLSFQPVGSSAPAPTEKPSEPAPASRLIPSMEPTEPRAWIISLLERAKMGGNDDARARMADRFLRRVSSAPAPGGATEAVWAAVAAWQAAHRASVEAYRDWDAACEEPGKPRAVEAKVTLQRAMEAVQEAEAVLDALRAADRTREGPDA